MDSIHTMLAGMAFPVVDTEPSLLEHDLVATSPTGSGKTMAYVVPVVAFCLWCTFNVGVVPEEPKPRQAPSVLIITPTRELCRQVEQVVVVTFLPAFHSVWST